MDDWREPYVKKKRYLNLVPIIGIAILSIFCILFLVIVIVSLINSNLINFKQNNLDVVGTFAVIVAGFALLYAEHTANSQTLNAVKLSLLESEIHCFEISIDKFYLPLLNLLSGRDGEAVDLAKLNEINCHRYLAKPCILKQFNAFYKECNETKKLPDSMSDVLLITVNDDIDSINSELMSEYRKFMK
jgi:hypothetical protein